MCIRDSGGTGEGGSHQAGVSGLDMERPRTAKPPCPLLQDVYKRQTQTLVWEFVTGCREATGSYNQTSTTVYSLHFGSNYANSGARAVYDPVSYTHLDVYKRQVHGIR